MGNAKISGGILKEWRASENRLWEGAAKVQKCLSHRRFLNLSET